jgi:hypothetical protein
MYLEKRDRPIENIDHIIFRNNPIHATPSQKLIALNRKSPAQKH